MLKFQSVKVIDGFSTCFRQWKAKGTHCSFIHGYDISFELTFQGELDERNWVYDFGGFKRAKFKIDDLTPAEWFKYFFDHTLIVAEDDPHLQIFKQMHTDNLIQLRVLKKVGCEMFAQFVLQKVNKFLRVETEGRVLCTQVKCSEHPKNSSIAILTDEDIRELDGSVFDEYLSLYDYLGKAAGPELGQRVAKAAYDQGIEMGKRPLPNSGYEDVLTYPRSFLLKYFSELIRNK